MCVVNQNVRPQADVRRGAAVDTLIAAFENDPLYRWLFDDRATRRQALRDNFTLVTDAGISKGGLVTMRDDAAAAIWTDLDEPLLDDPSTLLDVLSRWSSPARLAAAGRAMDECSRHRPVNAAVLHLIGVRPDRAGNGIGSALLRRRLAERDQIDRPVYLESSNPRNHRFYARHGFVPIADVQLGAGGPRVTCMVRPPAS